MKKLIIAVGLLLFAAVFMSGCVTEAEDPIVGIWKAEGPIPGLNGVDHESITYVFNADGTGFSLTLYEGELASGKLDFTWKNQGEGKYSITMSDVKATGLENTLEFVLEDEILQLESLFDFHKEPAAEYMVGLWASELFSYEDYEDITGMVYFAEDGTGNVIFYGTEVMGIDDIFTLGFTWEEKDGKVSVVDETGDVTDFTLKNGELIYDADEKYHKYTIEDRLLGLWMSDEPSEEEGGVYDIVILIRPDGTGTEIWTAPGSHVAAEKYYFTWEMVGSYTYQAVYNDGEVWDFTTVGLGLTDGEVTYSKVGYDVLAEYAQKVTA